MTKQEHIAVIREALDSCYGFGSDQYYDVDLVDIALTSLTALEAMIKGE